MYLLLGLLICTTCPLFTAQSKRLAECALVKSIARLDLLAADPEKQPDLRELQTPPLNPRIMVTPIRPSLSRKPKLRRAARPTPPNSPGH